MKKLVITVFLCCCASSAMAYDIKGNKWPGAKAEFHVDLSGSSATGILWNTAFIDALDEWNAETTFNFALFESFKDPCISDGTNSVDFTSDVCGTEYGSKTLAVTIRRFGFQLLGPARITEADIVVNQSESFDIFDGNLVQFGKEFAGLDFRRVALHELGHAIGLDHDELNALPAIMAPTIGNLDRLQADDIAGVNALYGGLSNCNVEKLAFGTSSDALSADDCTVAELTVGGSDTSFIDIYQFEVAALSSYQFEMSGTGLDSVLILADSDFNFIAADDKTTASCDSNLSESLQSGTYYLLANTYDVPAKADCANFGDYALSAYYDSTQLQRLTDNTSLQGGSSTASFSGGITANGGLSFGNHFTANQSLDITASIEIDSDHIGELGFLIVAAVVDNQILLLNSSGAFIDSAENAGVITHAADKTLQATEDIQIASKLIPASLGIEAMSVGFVVGYGLASEPGEVFYHQTPFNLTIQP